MPVPAIEPTHPEGVPEAPEAGEDERSTSRASELTADGSPGRKAEGDGGSRARRQPDGAGGVSGNETAPRDETPPGDETAATTRSETPSGDEIPPLSEMTAPARSEEPAPKKDLHEERAPEQVPVPERRENEKKEASAIPPHRLTLARALANGVVDALAAGDVEGAKMALGMLEELIKTH